MAAQDVKIRNQIALALKEWFVENYRFTGYDDAETFYLDYIDGGEVDFRKLADCVLIVVAKSDQSDA